MAGPENLDQQRKDAILACSPYLQLFLNNTYRLLDPEKYTSELGIRIEETITDINKAVGEDVFKIAVFPIALYAAEVKTGGSARRADKFLGTITGVTACGYEIGNSGDAMLFVPDIFERVRGFASVGELPEIVLEFASIRAFLRVGVFLRYKATEKGQNIPDSIRTFIEGLDL